jgi:DNA polymerase-3 subunit alpha
LNALPKIKDLVKMAKKLEMPALALTDAGNMYGIIDFYQVCKKNEIKPIIGVDFYVASRKRKDKQGGVDNRRTRLVLLAKNEVGYKNLIKLVTDSYFEGFYYKPRIDKETIEKYKDGLICILPHFSAETSYALKNGDTEKAKGLVDFYKNNYGAENFFLEITHHPEIEGQLELKEKIKKLAKETNSNLVAGQDVYYLHPEDKKARDTLVQVNSHSDFSDREQRESADNFSFISGDQAAEYFKDEPEAIENTQKIADMCNVEIELGKWKFPKFVVESGLSYDDELKRVAYEGIDRRGLPHSKEVIDRLEYELKVIHDKGYPQYFLVVSDLLRFAHENGIYTNIRGSVAGSLTTYVTGITNVDPLAYKLPFERFLNPERPSAPDIDMDFADNRRDEVIEYARKKYGKENVAQIGTFGTMMARGACRDVARAMGFPLPLADKIAKLIPMGAQGFPMTIDRALKEVAELKEMYNEEEDAKTIIDMAQKIEGCARHISVHAAGVVIAPDDLSNYVPLQYDPKGEGKIITQYDMHGVGEDGVGLLKFDFLGIKNLSILADAVDRVKKIEDIDIDIEKIPLDDKKTFEMLAKGETIGLFQLNGSGMTKYLKELKPTTIHDINAMVALYRPGPIESIPQYIERKHNPALIKYLDPRLKDILDQSYGVITYQDDVMLTAIKLAGYSWLEADKLRKAMGKKIPEEMEKQKEKLLKGFVAGGLTEKKAETLWKLIEPFAAYGFNKCLTGDTRISDTKSGRVFTTKEIYEKNLEPEILTMDSKFLLEKKPVISVLENGVKEVFEVKTKSGRTIKATSNHPLFAFSGWKDIGEIKTGERIAVPRNLSLLLGKKEDKEKAAVLGYLISEGNLCHPHGIYFYSTREDEIKDFIKNCKSFENFKYTIDRSKSAASVYCGQEDQKKGNTLNSWIEELGLKNKKATEKKIPECVYGWNKETLSVFMGKMWQGDGCVSISNEQTYYATSSKELAKDMQHLLLRLEILSTIHTKSFKHRGKLMPGYTVVISHRENLRKFLASAGQYLIGNKKKDIKKLVELTKNTPLYSARGTKDIIPAEILEKIREIMKEKNISVAEISQKTNLSKRLFSFDKRKIGYQREVIKIIGKYLKSDELLQIANSDIYWDEIVSIKKSGKEITYDITLPPHHNFIANDIVVHNSHAASYGRVAYQTAYMKANFPEIYMSAVMTADQGDVEKIGEFITECNKMKIPVLPPSVNESFSPFSVVKPENPGEQYKIRFGLTSIKNFGEGISKAITSERKNKGKFKSLSDFLERIVDKNLNKRSLEPLIKTGALDEFGERGQLLANVENLLKYNKDVGKMSSDQDSLFGIFEGGKHESFKLEPAEPATQTAKLAWEKDLLGLYISGHPLDKYKHIFEKQQITIKKIKEETEAMKKLVDNGKAVGGIIQEVREIMTKKNEPMAFIKIADLTDTIEAVVFPRTYAQYKSIIVPEKCVAMIAKISERNGEISLIIDRMKELV